MRKNFVVRKIVFSGLMLAVAFLLPFLTGQIPQVGSMLLPMHLPVMICGFACGWPWGLAVGVIAPLLRSLIMTMPPMFPTAIAMAFELAAYGVVCGLLYARFPKRNWMIYAELIVAMVLGRIVWGIVTWVLMLISGGEFTWGIFMAGAVLNAVPGIILQIVIVPPIVMLLKKAGFMVND
ncbi:MAG: ECF transporter S component [Ruminococcaceae bacterium]|nr:ECF transporter S component [Oscillospiraceae bacterium]